MPVIRANRDSIDDRFSVLGFNVRTESPLFEVGIATDPDLFKPENRPRRTRRNFYSSRMNGAQRARRGEAVYLVPPEVMSGFVGSQRLYFGLATYSENNRSKPDFVQSPTIGNMYVNVSGLTERGLRRLLPNRMAPSTYGKPDGPDPALDWGGDTVATVGAAAPATAPANGTKKTNGAAAPAASAAPAVAQAYRDGYSDDLWSKPAKPAKSAPMAGAQEIITPFYDPKDPASALTCQDNAFSQAREEWFVGVDSTQVFPHSAICQINTVDSAGNGWGGTGFYIDRNRILTAAHVLQGMVSATIIPGKNGSEEPFRQCTVNSSSWRVAPTYTGSGNYDNDLAVIDNVPIAAPNGQWFRFLNATPSDRMPIVVCGYSGASDAVPALTQAIDGDKQHLHGGFARSMSNPEVIEYPILTLHGASGAPVYHLDSGSGQLQALICAVHVTGAPAAQGLNRGCFITPTKIDWIEGRTTAFALDATATTRARPAALRASSPNKTLRQPRSSAQGMFDLLPVDLKLRVFIPAPVVIETIPVQGSRVPGRNAHGGDGRGFQLDGGSSRAEVTAKFHFGGGDGAKPTLTDVTRRFGESTNYDPDDTVEVSGKPSWYRNLRPGAKAIERGSQTVSDAKLNVALGGSANDGMVSMAENAVVVTFDLHASDPIVTGAPDIDATLAVMVKVDGDRVKARVRGGHDEFPAYELYANGVLVYSYDPVAAGGTPWGLLGDGNWDVNPETDYLDVGPASEYRVIGPVRIGGTAAQGLAAPRALSEQSYSIHWDTVPYYPQQSEKSCWAAAAAMVVGWRDGVENSDAEIAAKVPAIDAYRNGLWPSDRHLLADVWNLVPEPPASYTIDAWRGLLESCGPLFLDMTNSAATGGHAWVLVGMTSDGAADGSDTTMYLHNPWPSRGKVKLSFADFLRFYEGRVGTEGATLECQIMHSASIPEGRRPAGAAPFALTLMADVETAPAPGSESAEFRLVPPPAPIVEQALGVTSRALVAPVIIAIAAAVVGAISSRLLSNEGDVSWELDQLNGLKHPNDVPPSPMPAASDGRVIRLTDWPIVEAGIHGTTSAGFEIGWQYNGKSVGNIAISNVSTTDAVLWGLAVKAHIINDAIVYPRENPAFAAIKIRFEYRFSRTVGDDLIAIRDVHLFGNGAYNIDGHWEQT